MSHNVYLYILVMATVRYLIRMLPVALAKNEIKSAFINSFLYSIYFISLKAASASSLLIAPN